MSKKIFAANWKLNKTPEEAREFVIKFKNDVFKTPDFFKGKEVILFPSAFSLEAVSSLCAGTAIGFGPQNIHSEKSGAFTGENSAEVAQSMKAQYALVGHSERREIFKEQDELLDKKNALLQVLGLNPVFCIGESLAQREAGKTLEICFAQMDKGLKSFDKSQRLILAYEPVWAIGTGKVATPEQVAEVHRELHQYLTKNAFKNFQILYGGSVKPENSKELLAIPHVDGFLIGGAALQVESFIKICTI
ncbi:triose-phosphate isomerase [bacterium]|nr:triose-phosphate isomerase [bacterium]